MCAAIQDNTQRQSIAISHIRAQSAGEAPRADTVARWRSCCRHRSAPAQEMSSPGRLGTQIGRSCNRSLVAHTYHTACSRRKAGTSRHLASHHRTRCRLCTLLGHSGSSGNPSCSENHLGGTPTLVRTIADQLHRANRERSRTRPRRIRCSSLQEVA